MRVQGWDYSEILELGFSQEDKVTLQVLILAECAKIAGREPSLSVEE